MARLIDPSDMSGGFLASALRVMANNYWKTIHWSPLPDATYLPNYRTEYKRLLESEKQNASGINKYLSKVTDMGSQVRLRRLATVGSLAVSFAPPPPDLSTHTV